MQTTLHANIKIVQLITISPFIYIFFFTVKPFCKPDQTTVYGVAKREKIHVSCEVVANPKDNIHFNWVFNSSSEKLDLQENLLRNEGSRSIAEHTPQVITYMKMIGFFKSYAFFNY